MPVGKVALRIAQDILCSGEDPLRHIRDFEELWIIAGHSEELRNLGTLDDEVSIAHGHDGHGQSLALIREWVTERLKDFIQSAPA